MSHQGDPVKPSQFSRRKFLTILGAGLTLTAVSAMDPQRVWANVSGSLPPLEHWRPSDFTANLGRNFSVTGGPANELGLALIRVENSSAKIHHGPNRVVAGPADACFKLVFRGPAEPVLPQSTYEFAYGLFGKFLLFITPAAASAQGQNYTAIINHVQA